MSLTEHACPHCGGDVESAGGIFFPRGVLFDIFAVAFLFRQRTGSIRNRLSEYRERFTMEHDDEGLSRPRRVLTVGDLKALRALFKERRQGNSDIPRERTAGGRWPGKRSTP